MTTAELKTTVDQLKTETAAALQRVADDVQYLKDKIAAGEVAQADVDAVGAGIQSVIASLQAVDPVAENPAAPVEPTV